jgi:hypothetical protein
MAAELLGKVHRRPNRIHPPPGGCKGRAWWMLKGLLERLSFRLIILASNWCVSHRATCNPRFIPCPTSQLTRNTQAAISSDKYLRIYECLEQPSLATWQVSEEVNVEALPASSPFYMTQGHTVALATPTQANAPHDGASASLVAQALQSHSGMQNSQNKAGLGNREADGGYCISWCKDRYWGEVIAAGCGVTGVIKVRIDRRLSSFLITILFYRSSNFRHLVAH